MRRSLIVCQEETKRRFIHRARGLTLVEIVIALMIAGLLAMAITSSVLQLLRQSESLVRFELAAAVADGFVEQMRAVEFTQLAEYAATGGDIELVARNNNRITILVNNASFTTIEVPLTTLDDGTVETAMDFRFRIRVTMMADGRSVAIRVPYSWDDPFSRSARQNELVLLTSAIPR